MLKLNASYSKKVPVDGQDYSSQSYHASVEVELSDGLSPDELRGRIHETFELVRHSVESELHGDHGAKCTSGRQFAGRQTPGASAKQLKYLRDVAIRRGMTLAELDDEVRRRLGIAGIDSLDRRQASDLIDELNGAGGRAGQRRAA